MNALRRIEDRINALSDQDWAWWPLLRLRPARNQRISHASLLVVSLVFGGTCGIAGVGLLYLMFEHVAPTVAATLAVMVLALFYLAAKYTLYTCWNARAARLQSAQERANATPAAADSP